MKNPVYRTMADAAAGMHEIVSLILVAKAVEEREYDYLVIDTAPSRNALDFVSYPGRLAVLFEGRAVAWLGQLAQRVNSPETHEKRGGLFAGAQERIENLFSRILNARFLLGESARYVLVAAPTGSAQADAVFLSKRLGRLNQTARVAVLNRADEHAPSWVDVLKKAAPGWPALGGAIQQVEVELASRKRAGDRLSAALTKDLKNTPQLRLPTVEAADPAVVVRELATQLTPSLKKLAG
jgi:hypothetical protein